MPLARWTHDTIKTGLMCLVFFALLRAFTAKWGSNVPGLQAVVNQTLGS